MCMHFPAWSMSSASVKECRPVSALLRAPRREKERLHEAPSPRMSFQVEN